MPSEEYLSKLLTLNGAGASHNANGNYAVDTYWEYRPGATEEVSLHRLLIQVRDSGPFDAEKYGNILGGLTNGVRISVVRGTGGGATLVHNVTDPLLPILSNSHWQGYCFDYDFKIGGAGDGFGSFRWTFARAGVPVRLRGSADDALRVTLEDNLTGLVEHLFVAQGVLQTP